MAITIGTNFGVTTNLPLDSRYVVADETARNALASGIRYDGLVVYQQDTDTQYQLQNGVLNIDWVELTTTLSGNETLDGGTWS